MYLITDRASSGSAERNADISSCGFLKSFAVSDVAALVARGKHRTTLVAGCENDTVDNACRVAGHSLALHVRCF